MPSSATDCPGTHADPNLGGDPPGHHPPSNQEHVQTLSGVQTGTWGLYTRQVGSACGFNILTLILGAILNPALIHLVIVVSIDSSYIYTMYSKYLEL